MPLLGLHPQLPRNEKRVVLSHARLQHGGYARHASPSVKSPTLKAAMRDRRFTQSITAPSGAAGGEDHRSTSAPGGGPAATIPATIAATSSFAAPVARTAFAYGDSSASACAAGGLDSHSLLGAQMGPHGGGSGVGGGVGGSPQFQPPAQLADGAMATSGVQAADDVAASCMAADGPATFQPLRSSVQSSVQPSSVLSNGLERELGLGVASSLCGQRAGLSAQPSAMASPTFEQWASVAPTPVPLVDAGGVPPRVAAELPATVTPAAAFSAARARNKSRLRSTTSSGEYYLAGGEEEAGGGEPSKRPVLPVLLPHKLDWIALAYDRSPEFRYQRDVWKEKQQALARRVGAGAAEGATVVASDAARGRGGSGGGGRSTPESLLLSRELQPSHSTPQLSQLPPQPLPPSTQTFDKVDIGLSEVARDLMSIPAPPPASALPPAVVAARSFERSQSEARLDAQLAKHGSRRLWVSGDRGREGGKGSDKWSLASFDRLTGW